MKIFSKQNNFKKDNLRRGYLYFDKNEVVEDTNYRMKVPYYKSKFYYIYDSVLHVNFAKLQDAEDWENAENLEFNSIKNIFVDLLDDLNSRIDLKDKPGPEGLFTIEVYIDFYGAGNRHTMLMFEMNGYRLVSDPEDCYRFDVYKSFNSGVWGRLGGSSSQGRRSGSVDLWLTTDRIQPDSSYMRRKIIPNIIDYLGSGYSLLD